MLLRIILHTNLRYMLSVKRFARFATGNSPGTVYRNLDSPVCGRPGQMLGNRRYRGGLAQDRALAPSLNCKVQDHVPRRQRFLASRSTGRQNGVFTCSAANRRARSLQEVVYQRELIGREVRPIQKRKLCSLHDGSIVDLAHSPGEYCDRCVGNRVHK